MQSEVEARNQSWRGARQVIRGEGEQSVASDGGPRRARLGLTASGLMTRAAANDLGRGYSARRETAAIFRDSGRGVPLGGAL